MTEADLMVYVHIPFCMRKCNYCDFLSKAGTKEERSAYLKALEQEIIGRKEIMGGRRITSLFFGGGTPSLLTVEEMAELMAALRSRAAFSPDVEITLECNPGTTDAKKLKGYHELGINRLSIGVQSARDDELRLLGRIHDWKQFLTTYEQAVEAGFTNINLDLMSSLPGQTMEHLEETLEKVLSLKPKPTHLSVYSLILEEGTIFQEWEEQGRFQGELALPSEEMDRAMIHRATALLQEAGYAQYEISNYAQEGFRCRHNSGYWTRRDYLGLGLGAASLLGRFRTKNVESLQEYLNNPLQLAQKEELSRKDEMEETVFLGLRMNQGVDRKAFYARFGVSLDKEYGDIIHRNCADGLMISDEDGIRLTQRGMDVSNYVMAQFL